MAEAGTIGYGVEGAASGKCRACDARSVGQYREETAGFSAGEANSVLGAKFRGVLGRKGSTKAPLSLDGVGINSSRRVPNFNSLVLGLVGKMSESASTRRRIKLWHVLLGTSVVAITLALLPNKRLGALIPQFIVYAHLLLMLLVLVIIVVKKLTKR